MRITRLEREWRAVKEHETMSYFYGSLEGQGRTTATRRGNKKTGIECHVRGWNHGVRVVILHNEHTGKDVVLVERTGGSNAPSTIGNTLAHYEVKGDL